MGNRSKAVPLTLRGLVFALLFTKRLARGAGRRGIEQLLLHVCFFDVLARLPQEHDAVEDFEGD